MAEVKILIEGYTSANQPEGEKEKTCPTITLVRTDELTIIVDPGVLASQEIIQTRLAAEGLQIIDVNMVFITHSHLDHYRNIGMFAEAPTLEFWGLWQGNKVFERPQKLGTDIEIINTPGHSADSLTMLVKTNQGKIAICGDVFWKENQPETDPYASDPEALEKSRQQILAQADWIIPGHGKMYRVNK